MANNGRIRLLRTTTMNLIASSEQLVPGQPLYISDKNYLTVGSVDKLSLASEPITVRKVVGYYGDSSSITNVTTDAYEFSGDSINKTYIKAPDEFNVNINNDNHLKLSSTKTTLDSIDYYTTLKKNTLVDANLRLTNGLKVIGQTDLKSTTNIEGVANLNNTTNVKTLNVTTTSTFNGEVTINNKLKVNNIIEGSTFTGNAASATILQNTRKINGTNFNGSESITTTTWGTKRKLTLSDDVNTTFVEIDGGSDFTLPIPKNLKLTSYSTPNWKIQEDSSYNLVFSYNGVNKVRFLTTGEIQLVGVINFVSSI